MAAPATPAPEWYASDLLTLMNQERAGAGLAPLETCVEAVVVAHERALDMAARGYFAHVAPDGSDAGRMLARTGVLHSIHAENIARADYPGDQVLGVVHAALMASEAHRGNVLEPRFRRAGVGVAVSADTFYFAVIFID